MLLKKSSTVNKSLDNLKLLTNYLISDKDINITSLLTDSNSNSYKYRLISYFLKYPKIVIYINNFLNDLYTIDNLKYTLSEWLYSFKLICKYNNIKSVSQLYITKFKPAKRNSFKNEVKKYELEINDKILSEDELNELYRLYSLKIFSDEDLEEIKVINDGKDNKTAKIPFAINVPSQTKDETVNLASPILSFNNKLTDYIKNKISCKNCPLYSSPKYPVYSNLEKETDQLDFIIVGEFPSKEDFIEDHRYVKALLEKYNLKYLATNLVLCKPFNNEIPNANKTINNCKDVTNQVYKNFKSNYKILIGTNPKKYFNIKAPMTKVNGELINDCFILASQNYIAQHKIGLIQLDSFLEKYSKDKISRLNIEEAAIKSSDITFNNDLKDYTLFDIKINNEQLVYILIENKTGNKKYITENISYPVYIKKGTFRDCDYFVDNCDFVTYLSKSQKMMLTQQLKRQLNNEVIF